MEKLQFTIDIPAPALKVYEAMLGLNSKSTYESWASVFNPTSTYEGSWNKGDKIYFVGTDEKGEKAGMISQVEENNPAVFVSVRHYGFVQGNEEVTEGEMVEKWAGGHENYTFTENKGNTKVTVDIDVIDEYLDYFKDMYPKALEALKNIALNG